MAFTLYGTLSSHGAPVLRSEIVANSVALVTMDSVKVASGFVALGTAGALVLGHVHGISTNKGVGLNTTGVAGAEVGSFVGAFTMASDNQTVANVRAIVDISKHTLYSGTPDATIGTTTGSNLLGYHTDIADEDDIDEDTAATGTAQYTILGLDAKNSARGVYNIYESQIFGV